MSGPIAMSIRIQVMPLTKTKCQAKTASAGHDKTGQSIVVPTTGIPLTRSYVAVICC